MNRRSRFFESSPVVIAVAFTSSALSPIPRKAAPSKIASVIVSTSNAISASVTRTARVAIVRIASSSDWETYLLGWADGAKGR